MRLAWFISRQSVRQLKLKKQTFHDINIVLLILCVCAHMCGKRKQAFKNSITIVESR